MIVSIRIDHRPQFLAGIVRQAFAVKIRLGFSVINVMIPDVAGFVKVEVAQTVSL